ncbi:MAG: glycosyltransferase [Burkholderiaceae bacterium]
MSSPIRVAVLGAGSANAETGGAERLYRSLTEGFTAIGCEAELITPACDEGSFEQIVANYEHFAAMDLSRFDVVVSTKTPTYAIRHPRHVVYLVHTVRAFDDMFHQSFPEARDELYAYRAAIQARDFEALSAARARFAIGHEVAGRLYRWTGLDAGVLHPPLGVEGFSPGPAGDYFFLPGRLHPWKRVDLVIAAMRASNLPMRLLIAGTGQAEAELRRLAGNDPRIEFLGRIDDEALAARYAGALAVPFVPIREDYGYVTLEAFASGKPVLTCRDSGEPAHIVRHGESGLICTPQVESVRQGLEWLFEHREEAARMGQRGAAQLAAARAAMGWPELASRLLAASERSPAPAVQGPTRVAVLDMQPIDPPVGGGRQRLLGLYHRLGPGVECRYVGSYDWPGERYRRHRLSDSLEEIDVPLSDSHHAAAHELSARAGGKTVIDIAFGRQGALSPDYLQAARDAIAWAQVVVFSHPWVYPLVRDAVSPSQVLVYDSHNVEGFLRAQLLDEANPVEAELLRALVQDEYALGRAADLIFACSQEDLERFARIYEFPTAKMRVVPNGVMVQDRHRPEAAVRARLRRRLGIADEQLAAIFIGSPYGPNVEAARFIAEQLAPAMPGVLFVIAGGVGTALGGVRGDNLRITGGLDEAAKNDWFAACDLAVNPMFSGSGTNIKMFDFMAAALPTITTAIGARGIVAGGRTVMVVAEPTVAAFVAAIERLHDPASRERIGSQARACVEAGYAWERISEHTGAMLKARRQSAGQRAPAFSVVIPSYERPAQLAELMERLAAQIERDFEVIVIDQSARPWAGASGDFGFPLLYFHTPVKGAVRARNTGAALAQGAVIAFTDDDCLPEADWLVNARRYFGDPEVAGVEGMITSTHHGDPAWRPVTNVGFEGIGFMTANMMVRTAHFVALGGFDLDFDHPHFREDTDFGWRLQDLGRVPYAPDVAVLHPAQPRSLERESAAQRVRFFEKDALLYRKHPQRYRELFLRERHYEVTPGFVENLLRGFAQQGIEPPDWLASHTGAARGKTVPPRTGSIDQRVQ